VREAASVILRPAGAADLDAARGLLRAANLPGDGLEDQFGPGYVVAEAGGRVIGLAGIERYDRWGLLRSAVVDAAHRGTGLGGRLTDDRLAWAGSMGLEAVYLLTTTAAPFFARRGFETVDRASAPAPLQASKEFATACPASATCMRLALR